jgi:zinc/manganese transport system substrate-binding protein
MAAEMRRRVLAALLGALLVTAALPPVGAAQSRLRIVATLPDLYVITKALVGDAATIDVVARFGQNPHDMEVRPSHMLMLRRADVLVRNGLEEDAWIDVIALGSHNPKMVRGTVSVIEASPGIPVLKIPNGRVDRGLGDVHPLGSPHFTLDPANMPTVTENIARGLARIAPEQARLVEANRGAFLTRVAAAMTRWSETLAPYRGAGVVSYHDSWPYFYRAFGLVEVGIIEDRPGIPPSPQHIAALVRKMSDERVRVILHESWYARELSDLVAQRTGATVIVLPQTPGALKSTDDYIAHLDYLVGAMAGALR